MPGQRPTAPGSFPRPGLAASDRPDACAEAAARATSSFLTVTGVAGVGTTTWLRQFIAAHPRQRVISLSADVAEAQFAYAFADKLAHAAGRREGAVGASGVPDAMGVGRVLVAALTAGGHRRVRLVLDDAQWIDHESLRVLRFVLARLSRSGASVAIGGSTPGADEAARAMMADPADWDLVRSVRLRPLDAPGVRRYVSELHGREVSLRLAERIRSTAGGLPRLVDAVVLAMEHASPSRRWEEDAEVPALLDDPFSGWKVASTPEILAAVQLAGVLGHPVPRRELEAIAARLSREIDVDGALTAGLLVEDHDELRPFHDLYGAEMARTVDAADRSSVAAAAASTLSDPHRALAAGLAGAERLDDDLRQRMRHLVDDAIESGRAALAIAHLRSAAAVTVGREHDELVVEVCLLAAAAMLSPSVIDLIPDLEAMTPDPVRDLALLSTRQILGETAWASAYAAELLSGDLPHPDELLLRMQASMRATTIQLTSEDHSAVPEMLTQTRALAARLVKRGLPPVDRRLAPLADASAVMLRCTGLALVVAARRGDRDGVKAELAALSTLIASARDSAALVDALTCRAALRAAAGEVSLAMADAERAVTLVETGRSGWSNGHARVILAYCYWIQGRYPAATETVEAAISTVFDSPDVASRPLVYLVRALLAATAGDADAHAGALSTAGAVTVTGYDTFGVPLELLARLEEARATERWQDVVDLFDDERLTDRWMADRSVLSYRVDALAALGRAEEADRELRRIRTMVGSGWTPVHGSLEWLEGRVDEGYGLIEPARRAFLRAAALRFPPLPAAIARFDAGRMQLLVGDRDGGRRSVRAALAEFRALGAIPYVHRAVDLLDGRPGTPPPLAELESLTSREREVAVRAADGRTNAEIAHELFLSVPTVRFHMRNVLAKLGIASRRELAPIIGAARRR